MYDIYHSLKAGCFNIDWIIIGFLDSVSIFKMFWFSCCLMVIYLGRRDEQTAALSVRSPTSGAVSTFSPSSMHSQGYIRIQKTYCTSLNNTNLCTYCCFWSFLKKLVLVHFLQCIFCMHLQQGITDIKVEDTEDGSIIDLVGFTWNWWTVK